MKICPVCNDSFADELNFCDIDGTRLAREGSAPERNKWWSLLGAGLVVGALVISAASIFFLPKARVSSRVGISEPQSVPVAPRAPAPAAESASTVAVTGASSEPESAPSTESVVPEVKKRDRTFANGNIGGPAPNPKAAALAAEDADKRSKSIDSNGAAPAPLRNPEPLPAVKSVSDTQPGETNKPQPPPELKRDPRTQPTTAKVSDKDSIDKKKNDDKNKKKSGGFLRVFKKIFGKD